MEKLLHYIWKQRLFEPAHLTTTDGVRVQIIDTGRTNNDAGPDFFNAKIKIGDEMWAGNIEIHSRSSDWIRHNHHIDKAYDSVILHIVGEADMSVFRSNGEAIPQLVITPSPTFKEEYIYLLKRTAFLPCSERLHEIEPLFMSDWITALAMERMLQKRDRIEEWLKIYNGSWEEVCYVNLGRNLGFGLNSEPFERLVRSTPLLFLQKHANSLLQVEALLFGQAGLLEDKSSHTDSYYHQLRDEYNFLRHKFSLHPIDAIGWKFSRTRPNNFPHRRIALLAEWVHEGFSLFSKIIATESSDSLRLLFQTPTKGYWNTHYTFDETTQSNAQIIGYNSINIILINTAAPLLYSYGMHTNNDVLCDRALRLLEELKAEDNSIVRQFSEALLHPQNALESQALIQLHKEYCQNKKCLQCRIGHKLLARSAHNVK